MTREMVNREKETTNTVTCECLDCSCQYAPSPSPMASTVCTLVPLLPTVPVLAIVVRVVDGGTPPLASPQSYAQDLQRAAFGAGGTPDSISRSSMMDRE
ncbi:hypothetical protein BD414DRAFT_481909 [Trametes punicea]|nr:hypothetical protein BD414DRAFT_481909 [Trametes punicea]